MEKDVFIILGFLMNFAALIFSVIKINTKIDRRVTQVEIWLKILLRNVQINPSTLRAKDLEELNDTLPGDLKNNAP